GEAADAPPERSVSMDDDCEGSGPSTTGSSAGGPPPSPHPAHATHESPSPAEGGGAKDERPCSSPPLHGHSIDPVGSMEPLGPLRPRTAHAKGKDERPCSSPHPPTAPLRAPPSPVNGRGEEAPPPREARSPSPRNLG